MRTWVTEGFAGWKGSEGHPVDELEDLNVGVVKRAVFV